MSLNTNQKLEVAALANARNIPVEFALGVVDKESNGRAFWNVNGQQLPAIRFEGHYFYRNLKGAERTRAVAEGLASSKAGAVKNPQTYSARYALFNRAVAINAEAAYRSISIGIGQVMGEHYRRLGYTSAQQMYFDAKTSFEAQVDQMLTFIATDNRVLKAAQNYDYETFAYYYNGPNWRKNKYAADLERFVSQYTGLEFGPSADTEIDRIRALGYETVKDFQRASGIKVDGIIGPITREALGAAEKAKRSAVGKPTNEAGLAAGGAAVLGGGAVLADNPDLIEPAVSLLGTLAPYGTNIVLIGVAVLIAFAAWKFFQSRKIKKAIKDAEAD